MGSKPRHSSRRRKAGSSVSLESKPSGAGRRRPPDSQPNPDHDIGEDIATLEHGVSALRAVYVEFDIGIRELRA
jgi:hypothetical protein